MTKYFAETTMPVGFFNTKPDGIDTVEIDDETWSELISEQSNGKIITADGNGQPIAIELPAFVSDDEI